MSDSDKPLVNEKRGISIQLDDDFGRVQTRIKTRYNPSELMDKIVEEYEEKKEVVTDD